MPRGANFACTIFNYLHHPQFVEGSYIDCQSRKFFIKMSSEVEQPTPYIASQHRHLWIRSVRASDTTNSSLITEKRLVEALKEIFGEDLDMPYCKLVQNGAAYKAYINKANGNAISADDEIVMQQIRAYPRYSNSDVLASLIPHLGVAKSQSYATKMPILRDYIKQKDVQVFPCVTNNSAFIQTVMKQLYSSEIFIPIPQTLTQEQKVLITLHHLICLHTVPRMKASNGDCHFGLYLCGPAAAGKTTLTTGMLTHSPPPTKGIGKWNTSAPILMFDDWASDKLFTDHFEDIRRVSLGHDLTVSVNSSARNLGSKWLIITSNDTLAEQPAPIKRRFIEIQMPALTNPTPLNPDSDTLSESFLTYGKSVNWTPITQVPAFYQAYKTYSNAYNQAVLSYPPVEQEATTSANYTSDHAETEDNSSSESHSEDEPMGCVKTCKRRLSESESDNSSGESDPEPTLFNTLPGGDPHGQS